ncbi:MAG: polysaccharide biosynthesis/export family protein, partial [Kiritimatiellae bacterium]|nr:polysaccharide biosynthesis/export family protein [Kiritimatiellia bacterium]
EKWLNIPEEQPFVVEVKAEPSPFDQRGYARITATDGGVLYIDPGKAVMRVTLDDQRYDIPLSSLTSAAFEKKQMDEDGGEWIEVGMDFFGGGEIKARLVTASFSFRDSFGAAIECLAGDLLRFEGICRDLTRSSGAPAISGVWQQVELEMLDGRKERAQLPFSVIQLSRRSDGNYLLPSPLISSIQLEKNGLAMVETVLGDQIQGNLEQATITVLPPGGEADEISLKLRNLKSIRFIARAQEKDAFPEVLFLQADGVLLSGLPPEGVIRMLDRASGEIRSLVSGDIMAMSSVSEGWQVFFAEERGIFQPEEKALVWLAYCDGQAHEFRWKDIQGLLRGGYEPEGFDGGNPSPAGVELPAQEGAALAGGGEEGIPALSEASHPRMKPGHVLQISVLINGEKEIDEPFRRISSRGELSLPLLGNIRVAGLSLDALSEMLTKSYKEYFRDPQLVVQYVVDEESESASPWGSVTVLGKVKHPGKVDIPPTQDLTVSMAIQQAGGFDTSAKDTGIRVTRPAEGENSAEQQHFDVNLRSVGARGEVQNDMILQSGDIIYVPEMMF